MLVVSRCLETVRELYGHVHLLCHNILKIPHLMGLSLNHTVFAEKQWDAAL
jgi:hypothetical protein